MKDTCPEIARIPLRIFEKNMKRQQLCFFPQILKTPGFFSSKSCPLHVVIVVVHECIMHKFNTELLHFQFLYKTVWYNDKMISLINQTNYELNIYLYLYIILNRKVNDFLNSRNLSLLENWKLKKLDGWADV